MAVAKGSKFERKMCKKFSMWWTNNKRNDVFWRTSQSGGRATERQKKGEKTAGGYGDMMATHEIAKPFENIFIIEFKKGYDKDVGALILIDSKQKEPSLLKWWKKNEKIKVESSRKFGLVIFERNRRHPCIVMTTELFGKLEQYNGQWKQTNLIEINFVSIDSKIVIVPLYPFFNWCNSKTMKLFIKDNSKSISSIKRRKHCLETKKRTKKRITRRKKK